jgi:hypothetical protein
MNSLLEELELIARKFMSPEREGTTEQAAEKVLGIGGRSFSSDIKCLALNRL